MSRISNRQIAQLENPEQVLIDSKYGQLTEQDIWNHYQKYKKEILADCEGFYAFFRIKVDDEIIFKKKVNDAFVRLTSENFDELIYPRVVEVHKGLTSKQTDIIWVDLDAHEEFGGIEKVKPYVGEIEQLMRRNFKVQKVDICFSGRRGFYIVATVPAMNVDEARKELKRLLNEEYFVKDPKVTTSIAKPDQMRLDTTTLHENGSIKAEYSLHYLTGLMAMPVTDLEAFMPEQAKVEKGVSMVRANFLDNVDKRINESNLSPTIQQAVLDDKIESLKNRLFVSDLDLVDKKRIKAVMRHLSERRKNCVRTGETILKEIELMLEQRRKRINPLRRNLDYGERQTRQADFLDNVKKRISKGPDKKQGEVVLNEKIQDLKNRLQIFAQNIAVEKFFDGISIGRDIVFNEETRVQLRNELSNALIDKYYNNIPRKVRGDIMNEEGFIVELASIAFQKQLNSFDELVDIFVNIFVTGSRRDNFRF